MPFRISPEPWRLEDYKDKGYQILAADGTLVALLHYPKSIEDAANCKLVQKAPELLKCLKSTHTLLIMLLGQVRQNPRENTVILAIDKLIKELEIRDPVKKSGEEI